MTISAVKTQPRKAVC